MMLTDLLDTSTPEPAPKAVKNDFMETVFYFMDSISSSKENLVTDEEDAKVYKKCSFMVLRGLSQYADIIEIVNQVNMMGLPPEQEYAYLLAMVPKKHRRGGWAKKSPNSIYLRAVQEYYGYNEQKAMEAIKLLSVEQLTMIDNKNKKRDQICGETTSFVATGSK